MSNVAGCYAPPHHYFLYEFLLLNAIRRVNTSLRKQRCAHHHGHTTYAYHTTPRHATYHAMPCHATPRHIPCHTTPRHIPRHATYHAMPRHTTPHAAWSASQSKQEQCDGKERQGKTWQGRARRVHRSWPTDMPRSLPSTSATEGIAAPPPAPLPPPPPPPLPPPMLCACAADAGWRFSGLIFIDAPPCSCTM
jgi:hypothetical protein